MGTTCMRWAFSTLWALNVLLLAAPVAAQPNVDARRLYLGASGSVCPFYTGSGSPESVLTAGVCSVYVRTNGDSVTTIYIKATGSGNTGWVPVPAFSGSSFCIPYHSGTGITCTDTLAGNGFGVQVYAVTDKVYPLLDMRRARVGPSVVQSGDSVGTLLFQGHDGTSILPAAQISALVNGTPGTNDMPGSLEFSTTADGAASVTRRVKIGSASDVTFYDTDGTTVLSEFLPAYAAVYTDFFVETSAADAFFVGGGYFEYFYAGSGAGDAAYIGTVRSRGTIASPSIVQSGDEVMRLYGSVYDGSTTRESASIRVYVDGTPGSSDVPGRMDFYTTPDGSATSELALRLDSTKLLRGYGTIRSDVGFNVNGSAGESKTCTNAASFTSTGGIVTSCTAVDPDNPWAGFAPLVDPLWDELASLRAEVTRLQRLVLSMAGGRQ